MTSQRTREPINRWVYASSIGWPLIFIFDLIEHGKSEPYIEFSIDWIVVAAFLFTWPILTSRRLIDMGFDKRWALAFALPWAAFVITAIRGPRLAALVALCVLIGAQSFLVFWNGKLADTPIGQGEDPTP